MYLSRTMGLRGSWGHPRTSPPYWYTDFEAVKKNFFLSWQFVFAAPYFLVVLILALMLLE